MKTFEEKIVTNILDLASKYDLRFHLSYELVSFLEDSCVTNEDVTKSLIKANANARNIYHIDNNTHYNIDMSLWNPGQVLCKEHINPINMVMSNFFLAFRINGISKDLIDNFRSAIKEENYVSAKIMKEEIIKYFPITEDNYRDKLNERIEELKNQIDSKKSDFVDVLDLSDKMVEQAKRGEYEKVQKLVNLLMKEEIETEDESTDTTDTNRFKSDYYVLSIVKIALDLYLK